MGKVTEANTRGLEASADASRKMLFIELDSFQAFNDSARAGKAMMASLFFHWNQRVSNNTIVVLSGSQERRQLATTLIQRMGLNHSNHFVEEPYIPVQYKDTPESHLFVEGYDIGRLKAQHAHGRFLALKNAGSLVGVFAFAPIESLAELVADPRDIDIALERFREMTPYKEITKPQFILWTEGNAEMQARFPLTFFEAVDVTVGIRAYQLSQITNINA